METIATATAKASLTEAQRHREKNLLIDVERDGNQKPLYRFEENENGRRPESRLGGILKNRRLSDFSKKSAFLCDLCASSEAGER